MAETRGYSTNYTDSNTGASIDAAYLDITHINLIPNERVEIMSRVYQDEACCNSGKRHLFERRDRILSTDADWDTYFASTVVQSARDTITKKSMDLLKTRQPERV